MTVASDGVGIAVRIAPTTASPVTLTAPTCTGGTYGGSVAGGVGATVSPATKAVTPSPKVTLAGFCSMVEPGLFIVASSMAPWPETSAGAFSVKEPTDVPSSRTMLTASASTPVINSTMRPSSSSKIMEPARTSTLLKLPTRTTLVPSSRDSSRTTSLMPSPSMSCCSSLAAALRLTTSISVLPLASNETFSLSMFTVPSEESITMTLWAPPPLTCVFPSTTTFFKTTSPSPTDWAMRRSPAMVRFWSVTPVEETTTLPLISPASSVP